MDLRILKPRQALNKAYLKVKPNRRDIEKFKANLIQLLDSINESESEEFHKNLVSDFLKKTYYDPNYFINTKGRNDLVIHNDFKATSTVGVIIEAKKPANKSEMVTKENLNAKAFHELMLYYLRERITLKNLELKHLIITNINEWFIFDAVAFERLFAQNKKNCKTISGLWRWQIDRNQNRIFLQTNCRTVYCRYLVRNRIHLFQLAGLPKPFEKQRQGRRP